MRFNERNILITGGSAGLGRALALGLAAQGGNVVIVARHAARLELVVQEIREAGGVAHAVVADVSDKQATYAIAGQAAALVGTVDLLIHAASTLGPTPMPLLLDTECEDLEQVMATNVIGPFRLTRALLGAMVLRDHGTIVSVSSDAAVEAYGGWGAYGVSKAAQDHLIRIWSEELRHTKLRFLSVDPGEMDTAMHALAFSNADPTSLLSPMVVAERIFRLLKSCELPSGARVLASDFGVDS